VHVSYIDESCGEGNVMSNEMYFMMPNIAKISIETNDNGNHYGCTGFRHFGFGSGRNPAILSNPAPATILAGFSDLINSAMLPGLIFLKYNSKLIKVN